MNGEEYQNECDIYFIQSLNQEMYLHQTTKSTLSLFDDKGCYINNIEKNTLELKLLNDCERKN